MPPPPLDADSADLSDGAETSDEEAPVEHRTRMLFDPSGRLRTAEPCLPQLHGPLTSAVYIGETGSLSILARARKLVHTCFGQSSFTQDSAQNSIADTPLIPHMQYSLGISSVLPPHQRATALVDLFFQHVNRVYYVLDRAEMDQIMATVYSGGILPPATGNRLRDMSFVNAVCAVGTFFNGRSEQSVADGMRYFDSSRSVMEDVFESSDFFSVRHLLIFALYMQYAAKRNSAWTYVGLAIRVAESLGLHRLSSIEHSADPFNGDIDLERRRRLLFWTLYSLDRFTGCSLGRPLAVDDDNCNDPIFSQAPSDDYLVDSRCTRDQPDVIHQRHQLASRVRLHVIIGHIVKRVYLRRAISRDVAESLSEELKAWWKSLPSCASLNGGTDTGVMQLHMTYLHAVTLLTRPFLQQVVEASVEESMGGDDCQCKRSASSRSRIKRKMLRYAVACVLVAERTVTLALRMHKQGNLTRNDPTLM